MATNPVYLPPPPDTTPPTGTPSDHGQIHAVYTATNAAPTQGGVSVTIPLILPPDVNDLVESTLSDPTIDTSDDDVISVAATTQRVVRLQIQNITMPVVANSGLRVFLNHPKAHANVANNDAHHVANVAYFCCGHAGMQPCFIFDVTRHMKRLRVRKLAKAADGWNVQVLSTPLFAGTAAPTVVPGTVTLTVASF